MNRRETLRMLGLGAIAGTTLVSGCQNEKEKTSSADELVFSYDRSKEELEREKALLEQGRFFTDQEMASITILADIIIPKDEVSGSASEAKVPEFIDFIVRDMPNLQLPVRGGLRWLDVECLKRFNRSFSECKHSQRIEVVDDIAYPNKAKAEMQQGVAFFSRMRNLVASGFYTSEMGVADLDYRGNTPNQWNGVPDEVLKQYQLAYTEKELKECVKF